LDYSQLSGKIDRFIELMKEKHQVVGAMVTGSYVTQQMQEHSDIDIFLLGADDAFSARGRMFFEDQEFEYFISPEWKYFDRLEKDMTSVRIYSDAKILVDPNHQLKRIQEKAIEKKAAYDFRLNDSQKIDFAFYVETVYYDGIDLYDAGAYEDFLFFTNSQIKLLCDIAVKYLVKMPVYAKHGYTEMRQIAPEFAAHLKVFLEAPIHASEKKTAWEALCREVLNGLGNPDTSNYYAEEKIKF